MVGENKEELTGIDTWHIVAPILVKYMDESEFGMMGKAYVNVYCALKYWDEHHKTNEGVKK